MPGARAAELSARVLEELQDAGFVETENGLLAPPQGEKKQVVRDLHAGHRRAVLAKNGRFVRRWEDGVLPAIANGSEVDPSGIKLSVKPVVTDFEAAVFRYCSLTWSVPVSHGFGRRTRFLIWDESNDRLFGLFALGDPVFNLTVRDNEIGWTIEQRQDRLYNVLDAFVMGAIGPYRSLLGGKMVALAAISRTTSDFIVEKYEGRRTLIRGEKKPARPVLITTTSALGRSSVYNRLRYEARLIFQPVGFTKGFGHFQFSAELFQELVDYLQAHGDVRGNRFGEGPNWKMRTLRAALQKIGLPGDLLKHGIEREVFLAPLGSQYQEYLRGETNDFDPYDLELPELTDHFRNRWAVPRASRDDAYASFDREQLRLSPKVVEAVSKQEALDLGL